MRAQIREAVPADVPHILPLFPRLANFELPPNRTSNHLWEGDAELLNQWAGGQAPSCLVQVAVDDTGAILGAAMTSLREELISHEPSAHLEVLVVASGAEGQGIGKQLAEAAEEAAQARGALSITLHVFGNNSRARGLYSKMGFDEELIRCIKHFE